MDDAFKCPGEKIAIPDHLLDLKTETRNLVMTVWHRVFILMQYLWLRLKLMSKSYKVRFDKAVQTILDAYQERTNNIYLLAIRSINHQGRVVYLKDQIKKSEGEVLKKSQELQTLRSSLSKQIQWRDHEVKKHEKVLEIAEAIKKLDENLSGVTYLVHCFWGSSDYNKKIEQYTAAIRKLDSSFFPEEDPKRDLLKGIDHLIETYRERSYYGGCMKTITDLNRQIDDLNRNITTLEEAIAQLEEDIEKFTTEIPTTENANKETLAELQKVTKNPDYYPIIDEEEAAMLGEHETSSSEASQINATDAPLKPERSPTYLEMIKDLKSHTSCRDLAILWVLLLNNDHELDQHIQSWKCDRKGNFSLELTQPIKLWIDTAERRGGCIFLFGDNATRSVTGVLKRSHIETKEGFDSYCAEKLLLNKRIRPHMHGIHFQNSNLVKISGTYLGQTGDKDYSFRHLREEWKDKVSLIPEDYPGGHAAYFEEKYN